MQITVFCDVVSCNLVYSTPTTCYYIQNASNLHSFCRFILGDKYCVYHDNLADRATPHAVCCRPLTAEDLIQSQASACEICGGEIGTVRGV